uniref:Ig-like domain-containing protein n=1 Tax=Pelodiscus sinensis TaxID=13735 RepID=K7FG65_PELSI
QRPGMAPTWLFAVLVAALLGGTFGAESVTQSEGSFAISQGDRLDLNCTYELLSTYPSLFWYVQYPGQAPRMLLQDSDEGTRKGFGATHDKKDKSFPLWKASVELSDSATYYCAGS